MAKCPVCKRYFNTRDLAVKHINKVHPDALTQSSMDGYQMLYYSTHGTLNGTCMCGCGAKTDWNPRTGKPMRVSSNPECRKRLKEKYDKNLYAKRGMDQHTLMSDMEHQQDMLSKRHISGAYRFNTDGGKVEYTGELEKNFLQFCDVVLDLPSAEILSAPEGFEYVDPKDKKTHLYIPDYWMPSYNLMVEIKDGGEKPNTNPAFLKETRYKVYLKDEVMRKQTKYNYIRISGKNYGPFVETLYNITHSEDDKKQNPIITITESIQIDPTVEEAVHGDRVHMLIRYESGMPVGIGLTDMESKSNWYLSDMLIGALRESSSYEAQYQDSNYKLYKYIGDQNRMVETFQDIRMGKEWYIPIILQEHGIYMDDGTGLRNNIHRRCDFILISEGVGDVV